MRMGRPSLRPVPLASLPSHIALAVLLVALLLVVALLGSVEQPPAALLLDGRPKDRAQDITAHRGGGLLL
jgi:hypothetical protein